MKLTLLLFFSLAANLVLAQSKNEQLYNAISNRDSVQVEKLLNDGADANSKRKVMSFESSDLIIAVMNQDVKIVQLLLDHKAEADWRDWFKTTALMYAAHTGNKHIVELLLAHGADPTAHDEQGNSVLSAAKESKNPEVITLIEGLQKK